MKALGARLQEMATDSDAEYWAWLQRSVELLPLSPAAADLEFALLRSLEELS